GAARHHLGAVFERVRQRRVWLAARRRGMADVAAIDDFGLARRTEAGAGLSLALGVWSRDREIASIATAHAPGLSAATGDPRALHGRGIAITERQYHRCARRRAREAAKQVGEEVAGLRRMRQAAGAEHQHCTERYSFASLLAHDGLRRLTGLSKSPRP